MGCGVSCQVNGLVMWLVELLCIGVWFCVRWILVLARQLEALGTWLLETVLGTAYGAFLDTLYPFVLLSAGFMVVIFGMAYFLQGIIESNPVKIKRAVPASVMTFVVFTVGSNGLVMFMSILAVVGQLALFFGITVVADAGGINYMVQTDADGRESMPETSTVYGSAARSCPGFEVRRQTFDFNGDLQLAAETFHLNDAAILMSFATAIDVHCPPSSQSLPPTFRSGDGDAFQGYFAETGETFMSLDDGPQKAAIILGLIGIMRLLAAGIVAIGSLIEHTLGLMYVLGTTSAFFGYASSRLVAWFVPLEEYAATQRAAFGSILWQWFLSYLWIGVGLGLTFLAIIDSGNVFLVFGMGFLTACIAGVRLWVSYRVFHQAMIVGRMTIRYAPKAAKTALGVIAGSRRQTGSAQPVPAPASSTPTGPGWRGKVVAGLAGAGLGIGAGMALHAYLNRDRTSRTHRSPPRPRHYEQTPPVSTTVVQTPAPSWATTRAYATAIQRRTPEEPTIIEGTLVNKKLTPPAPPLPAKGSTS